MYIAAFGLDEGESLGALLGADRPRRRSRTSWSTMTASDGVDDDGFGWLPEDDFVGHFAADVHPDKARVLHAVQQPIAMNTFEYVMGVPAWKSLPTCYLVAENDEAIPPDAERQFAARMGATTVEGPSSHLAMVSHPESVAQLIQQAAKAAPVAG